jgi:hypothetical protein
MKYERMSELQLLAAETYNYSYANYADHLGVNIRFDKYMPNNIKLMERLIQEGKGVNELAKQLKIDKEDAEDLLEGYSQAKQIVHAKNAAESFRFGVKQSILYALEQGLSTESDVDDLTTQICYRAADLGYLLDMEGKELSDYSEELRYEPECEVDVDED